MAPNFGTKKWASKIFAAQRGAVRLRPFDAQRMHDRILHLLRQEIENSRLLAPEWPQILVPKNGLRKFLQLSVARSDCAHSTRNGCTIEFCTFCAKKSKIRDFWPQNGPKFWYQKMGFENFCSSAWRGPIAPIRRATDARSNSAPFAPRNRKFATS